MLDYKYNLEDIIIQEEKDRDTKQVFTECTQYLVSEINIDKNNLALIDKIYKLAVEASTLYQDTKAKQSSLPISMINAAVIAWERRIKAEIDSLNIELTKGNHDSSREGDKFIECQDEQQSLYEKKMIEYRALISKNDISGWLRILEETKQKLYKGSRHYAIIEESIAVVNEYQKTAQQETTNAEKLAADKAIAEKVRLTKLAEQQAANEQKNLELRNSSDGNYLASAGIVNQQSSEEGYRLNSDVLRQEVVGMAAKVGKFNLPEGYTCRSIFSDVTSAKPNTWACRAIEIAADNGVVSKLNKTFRPESNITRAEALAILLKAAGIEVNTWSTSSFSDVTVEWQMNVINTALSYGFIDAGTNFNPNKNATRGEIFNMAKRILEAQS